MYRVLGRGDRWSQWIGECCDGRRRRGAKCFRFIRIYWTSTSKITSLLQFTLYTRSGQPGLFFYIKNEYSKCLQRDVQYGPGVVAVVENYQKLKKYIIKSAQLSAANFRAATIPWQKILISIPFNQIFSWNWFYFCFKSLNTINISN